jgi:indolepyruvate ferredoxin oxidoreductase
VNLNSFISDVKKLLSMYPHSKELFHMALRTLAKTYFIKDEVYIAHMMISPMRKLADQKNYGDLGANFQKSFINRPSFNIGAKKIEFDFSPSPWMLKLMRHARFLRKWMPEWHKEERRIALDIRSRITDHVMDFKELKAHENVKGYREVRYEMYHAELKA